jgi:hypothetical protein
MSNPTTGNESQFNAPFNILPNARLLSPTRIITTQFNSDLGENSWSTTNNINDSATQFFSLNPTQKTSTVSQFSRPDQFSQKDSDRNIALTTKSFPVQSSNIDGNALLKKGIGAAASVLGGISGLTTITAGAAGIFNSSTVTPYNTLPFERLRNTEGVKYQDFRTKLRIGNDTTPGQEVLQSLTALKANGASAALRGSSRALLYTATSLAPGGTYSVFNIKQTYGYGEHDAPGAIRSDFTARSLVNTRWNRIDQRFDPTNNFLEKALPFRGDKVNVIDFGKRTLSEAYRWMPRREKILGIDLKGVADKLGVTQDFIKFYFTGPAIQPGGDQEDDIIAFRATITNMDDSFNADWNSVQMVGRADPNYHYSSFSRGGSLTFEVYATDRDELKPIYRKLNALASYTAPIYDSETITMKGPWMRLTVGDIHNQQPITLTSVTYTYGFDASWEINIEDDPDMMQVPMKVSVNCQFNIVSNDIPQNNGRLLSLAKRYSSGSAIQGDDNWLSDFKTSIPDPEFAEAVQNATPSEIRKKARELRENTDLNRKDSISKARELLNPQGN